MTLSLRFFAGAGALAVVALHAAPARACGGCFAPTGSATVVTRHQMAVSLSPEATTLWDQIEYAGDPDDFVWVLPVRGGVAVELADEAFFEALELETAVRMGGLFFPPTSFCSDGCPGTQDAGVAGLSPMTDVTVHHQATIGPYETVTVGSTDPDALVTWLRDNGYAVPDAILPTIRHYTDEGMDFAVLRLAPGVGVTQMQPVRVTMPGLNTVFPLRMVAAGVGGQVALELFVFGEGRYGTTNFEHVEVERSAVAYDWSTGGFTYDAHRALAAQRFEGRVWVTEFAHRPVGIPDYVSVDEEGTEHFARGDWEVATRDLTDVYLTRLTADLAVEHLGEDLVLGAVTGGDIPAYFEVFQEVNRPAPPRCPPPVPRESCPPWPEEPDAGTPAPDDDPGSPGGCSAAPDPRGSPAMVLLGALALSMLRRRG